jgi:predicted nuclease of predicted toxin-antitoxin system
MAIRLLADENFTHAIFRGLRETSPNLDIVRVQDVGLTNTDDPVILAWAAQEQRLVLTHDANTMTDFAYERVRAGQGMPGVIEISLKVPIGKAIEDILILDGCTEEGELEGQVIYLPL